MRHERESFIVSAYRFADSIMRYLKGGPAKRLPYKPQVSDVDRTCIILDKGMGDFILGSFYINKMIENYSRTGEVYIIADEYNYEFYKAYIPTSAPAKVIVLKANDIAIQQDATARRYSKTLQQDATARRYSKTLQQDKSLINYRGFFRRAIIPMSHITTRAAEIVRILSPVEIYSEGVYSKDTRKKYSILDYKVFKAARTFDIERDFYCKVHREFCKKLFGEDYGLNILEPIPTERLIPQKYFLVNVSANNKSILLEKWKFMKITREISEKTGLLPVIIGDMTSEELKQYDTNGFNLEYLNKHNMKEVISLCRYAEFVISPDTGTYHLSLSISNGPKVIIPTWSSHAGILFEPYPEEFSEKCARLKYIRMYKNCDECPEKCTKFFYKVRKKLGLRKITVPCVENLSVDMIINESMNIL